MSQTSSLDLEDQLLSRQMSDFISNVRGAAMGTLLSAIIIVSTLATAEHATFWISWIAALLLLDGLRLKHTFDFDSHSTDPAYIRKNAIYATILAKCCGLNWAIAFAVLWQHAQSPGEYLILCVLAAGIMSTALLQYRHLKPAAYLLMIACILAGTGIASLYPVGLAIPIILLTWVHGIIILRGVSDHSRFYRERLIEEIELERSEQTVRLLLHEYEASASDWLWEVDPTGRLLDITERFSEAAGRSAEDLEGCELLSLFVDGPDRDMLKRHINARTGFRDLIIQLAGRESETWWSISAKPLDGGTMRGVMSDVTAQTLGDKKLSRMARSDSLTGLANRMKFNETLVDLSRNDASSHTLLFVDLDKFKIINDTLGHGAGDILLVAVAKRIVQESGTETLVARLGGDEFAVVTKAKITLQQSHDLADRLVARLSDPFKIAGKVIRMSASIGIAHNDERTVEPEEWMRRADLALYAAKDDGRNCHRDYNATLHELERQRHELELDLRTALTEGQFSLDFQPQLDFATGKPSGMEALVRWNHPVRGLIMPDQFISIAEENGLIISLGEWIVRDALRQAAEWREPLTIALNLSSVQIRSERFIAVLMQSLAATGVAPGRVELEITETALLHDTKENVETLHKLRAIGVRIALDDFGTGYSSLNYLRAFPFDTIKIDRCFVTDLATRSDCQAIIKAIVGLAQELGMKTVAEGIEEREQFQWLEAIGCTAAQGYYISRPISSENRSAKATGQNVEPSYQPITPYINGSKRDVSQWSNPALFESPTRRSGNG
ncbi:EAL domain-containing protein [Parasphingorhabdus sp.]|uniref:putative bifunctional diguanylate cyclase/phosphodiesterase n=2 Tax=Parasphingorhabdus sp. TaxID=2709688 RepID=UPI0032658B89